MPYIDLTSGNVTPLDEEVQTCGLCNKPFVHYAKKKRASKNGPVLAVQEVDLITCHPECTKAHIKMEKIKARIVKIKKSLHTLRTAELNLQMEMFLKQQLKMNDDADEILVLLKDKGIINI